jgi:hypothetical protein
MLPLFRELPKAIDNPLIVQQTGKYPHDNYSVQPVVGPLPGSPGIGWVRTDDR